MSQGNPTRPAPAIQDDPRYCLVPLVNGGHAIVDAEDYPRVIGHRWYKQHYRKARRTYAVLLVPKGRSHRLWGMHRFLYGLGIGDRTQVDHRNHDGLDNRRSCNIRIATQRQNSLNRHKFWGSTSRYKGVGLHADGKRWRGFINLPKPIGRKVSLGIFPTEAEAAFAHQSVAPLVHDPAFLCLREIPAEEMPSPDRQTEIRRESIRRVKAALAGEKGWPDPDSKYKGVTRDGVGRWKAIVRTGQERFYLGSYDSEIEAAFAYDEGGRIVGPKKYRPNGVRKEELPAEAEAEAIRKEVSAQIKQTRAGRQTTSRFVGVTFWSRRGRWNSQIAFRGRRTHFGEFETEAEAAIAYNSALEILGQRKIRPNVIPADEMPTPNRIEAIRARVAAKLNS